MAKTQRWRRRSSAGQAPSEESVEEPPSRATLTETTPDEDADPAPAPADPEPRRGRGLRLAERGPVLLVQAAHPRQAILTAVFVAAAAALSGRPTREVLVVGATVLVGQAIIGWHNDLVDRQRDARHDVPGKPLAREQLDPGTVWFALTCAVLLVVPLAVTSGITAGSAYLVSLVVAIMGNVVLRTGFLSWLPWAVSWGLLPAYLSYGGWGGQFEGDPPSTLMVVLFALLGIGVHFLRALWGLVPDNDDGWTYLPLKLGLRVGATRLLVLSGFYTMAVLVAIAFAATYSGLAR
ncbi:UbiA family prenyltransferase [Nocardioides sp. cx-169]|uniref:UbiA family prenyltransferase n=1 Tax=Nocardioides sp. cx-169 TaxID=2899080 RepID=UPI001E5A48FC|nr:UbiA family prenyltransferase [Nocardioides sp. cx-169]MCD4533806.1 UbiA family prenyltransferase [Nocardioides sp. cx-169]